MEWLKKHKYYFYIGLFCLWLVSGYLIQLIPGVGPVVTSAAELNSEYPEYSFRVTSSTDGYIKIRAEGEASAVLSEEERKALAQEIESKVRSIFQTDMEKVIVHFVSKNVLLSVVSGESDTGVYSYSFPSSEESTPNNTSQPTHSARQL
ncbi:hypothetical protein [Neptuniibacter sp. QD57_21]|uniref:hypothetical protein n=1 Tax=Neptuniibacter sp. QD57_21 TaxID=3398213 RepID=UPI0039F5BF60